MARRKERGLSKFYNMEINKKATSSGLGITVRNIQNLLYKDLSLGGFLIKQSIRKTEKPVMGKRLAKGDTGGSVGKGYLGSNQQTMLNPLLDKPVRGSTRGCEIGSLGELLTPLVENNKTERSKYVHPENYSSIIGYRKQRTLIGDQDPRSGSQSGVQSNVKSGVQSLQGSQKGFRESAEPVIDPNVTLQDIRRVLHYFNSLKKAGNAWNRVVTKDQLDVDKTRKALTEELEIIVVMESRVIGSDNARLKKGVSIIDLLKYNVNRLIDPQRGGDSALPKITIKTTKETISYLAKQPVLSSTVERGEFNKGLTLKPCAVLMINPARSTLGSLADTIFMPALGGSKKLSAGNAIGALCGKKGIPLISLCDISSSNTYYTYPIHCDTRDIRNVYLVLDLLTYGLNRLADRA